MIVTTSPKPDDALRETAKRLARFLGARLVPRKKRSIARLMREEGTDTVLVVTAEGPRLYREGVERPFVYHPNTAMIRMRHLLRGDTDPMVELMEIRPGDRVLDCTLGLAADAAVLSLAVGEGGEVVGLESEPLIAAVVAEGLRTYSSGSAAIDAALRRIRVVCADHLDYLRQCADRSFDVVYFDPMFRRPVEASSGIGSLRPFANPAPLSPEAMREARRVARRMVVMKERQGSAEFARLGFAEVHEVGNSVAYGIIRVDAP